MWYHVMYKPVGRGEVKSFSFIRLNEAKALYESIGEDCVAKILFAEFILTGAVRGPRSWVKDSVGPEDIGDGGST